RLSEHARPDDPQNARHDRRHARLRHRAPYRADQRRHPVAQLRHALPRPPETRTGRRDCRRVGHIRAQPQGPLLQDHDDRREAALAGDEALGAGHGRPRALPEAHGGSRMRRLRAALIRLTAFLSRDDRSYRAFDAELESQLQLPVDDNIRSGMTPEEARRQPILKLGGIDRTRQAYRDQASAPILEHLVQDLQFALRHLVKAPGFTITAVVTMALGFGAALAIYAFAESALVQPLPYRDPARLVEVTERSRQVPHANMSHPDFVDWKRQQ